MRSIEQERAKYALKCIDEVKSKDNSELEKNYSSYVKKSPALILTNGLGSTLAFYKSKIGKEGDEKKPEKLAYNLLYDYINDWVSGKEYDKVNFTKGQDLLDWITKTASSLEVFQVTQEIVRLLTWMSKFAKAELKEESGGGE